MRRTLCLLLAGFALGAAAQSPARAFAAGSKRATKQTPTSLFSAKEEDPAFASTPSAVDSPSCDADSALARALLYAFEPAPIEIRVIAIEDLALLGDARALNALAQLLFDPNPVLQDAALKSISRFQTPRAEEILQNVVRHPQLSEKLKLQALNGLLFQRSPTSREFLARASVATSLSYSVREAAKKTLAQWGPPPSQDVAGAVR